LNYKDEWCGTIALDRQRWAKVLGPEEPIKFVAISDAKRFEKEHEYGGWAYSIPNEIEHPAWGLYYFLPLERDMNGIAYRVGLGKVFNDAFNNSCRLKNKQWRDLILGEGIASFIHSLHLLL
jgi:hypothetical protein